MSALPKKRRSRRPRQLSDASLAKKLDELHSTFDPDDVVVIWEAIGRVAARNNERGKRGSYPMPRWINDYLLRSADKISRLSLGVRPEDDRPLLEIPVDEIGELRQVPQSDRLRDGRVDRVAVALGFVRQGSSAFQRHDRAERDQQYLVLYDNDEATDADQNLLVTSIMKNEGISSEQAVRNRLSKARTLGVKCVAKRNPT
jgi:hypothetical protein